MQEVFTEKDINVCIDEFSNLLNGGLTYTRKKETLQNVLENPDFSVSLKRVCGVYYFIQGEEIKYVGRALPSVGLRSRIINQITAFGDEKWDTVIKDMNTEIGVIIFDDPVQWYFISALEHYLIEKLGRPIFNKRS